MHQNIVLSHYRNLLAKDRRLGKAFSKLSHLNCARSIQKMKQTNKETVQIPH